MPLADRGLDVARRRHQRGDARPAARPRPRRTRVAVVARRHGRRPARRARSTSCSSPTTRCSTWRTPTASAACFAAVAARLAPGGRVRRRGVRARGSAARGHGRRRALDDRRRGRAVDLRARPRRRSAPTATSCSSPTASGCACGRGRSATPRRPSSTRWRRPPGSRSSTRWEDFDRHPFGDDSPRHVSVYALDQATIGNAYTMRTRRRGPILDGTVSQMRLNPLTGRWVTIVAERARRPIGLRAARSPRSRPIPTARARSAPGNEDATLPALETVDDGGSWRMRVVPNLYPAFDGDSGFVVHHLGPVHVTAEASGIHEVFVYTPDHDGGLDQLDDDEAAELMHALQRRLAEHAAAPEVRYTPGDRQPRPRGRRVARPPARPDPRAAVRARRDPRRGAGVRPLRRRLRDLHHDRGRAGRRRAGRVRRRRRRVHRPVLERRAVRAAAHAAPPRAAPAGRRPGRASTRWAAAIRDAVAHLDAALGDVAYNLGFHTAPHEHSGQYHWHVHLWPNLVTAGRLRARHRRDDQRHAARAGRRDAARRPRARRDADLASAPTTTPRPTRSGTASSRSSRTSTGWPTPRSIRFVTDQTAGVGTRFECVTRVGPIRLTDRMEITEWEPGRAMGVRHDGLVTGTGRFTLEPLDGGRRTPVHVGRGADVPVVARRPVGARVGGQPVMRRIWRGQPRAAQDTRRTSAVTAAPSTITTISGARRHAAIAAAPTPAARASSTSSLPVENVSLTIERARSAPPARGRGSARRPAGAGASR